MKWNKFIDRSNYIRLSKDSQDNNKKKHHSFCLKVCKVNIPAMPILVDKGLIIRASLFDFNLKKFIGIQWNSKKFECNKNVKDSIDAQLNQTFYFHTSLIDESLLLVFELVKFKSDDEQISVGWGIFNLFKTNDNVVDIRSSIQSEPISIDIIKGTPRALLCMDHLPENFAELQKYENASIGICFNTNQLFDAFQCFIPENLLLDENDLVPGLKTNPNGRTDFVNPERIKFTNFSIDNMKIIFEPTLDDFENNFKHLLNADCHITDPGNLNKNQELFTVLERRLKIGVHNRYTFVEEIDTVYLTVSNNHTKRSRSSLLSPSKADGATSNELIAKNPVTVALPVDQNFVVIFLLEYVVSKSTNKDLAKLSDGVVNSSQSTYQIGWAIYQPFNEDLRGNKLDDGILFEMILNGGSEEQAPGDVLIYRSEIFDRSMPSDGDHVKEYSGTELKLSGIFKTKVKNEKEPIIEFQSKTLMSKENKKPPKTVSTEIPNSKQPPIVDGLDSLKSPVTARSLNIVEAQARQHRQMVTQQSPSTEDPYQLSSLLLGTPYPLVTETMANYQDLEPYVIVDEHISSARGLSTNREPLQMRSYSGVCVSREAHKNIVAAGFPDYFDSDGNCPLVIEATDSVDYINWSLEETDHRQADEILFQFIAMSRCCTNGSIVETKSVFFTFQFYLFPPLSTGRMYLTDLIDNISNYVTSNPEILKPRNKDLAGSVLKYLFHTDNQRERYSYLKFFSEQALHIDIWDGDSFMLIGSCVVPLKNLCRQGKASVQMTYELDIINQAEIDDGNISSIKGRLHLRMINLGAKFNGNVKKITFEKYHKKDFLIDATIIDSINHKLKMDGSLVDIYKHGELNDSRLRCSVVRPERVTSKHQELEELLKCSTDSTNYVSTNSGKSPLINELYLKGISSEKVKKILRAKKLMEGISNDNDVEENDSNDTDSNYAKLNIIQHYREQQKMDNIHNLLNAVVKKEITIYPKFGCTEIFEIKIKNHLSYENNIQIEIADESNCLSLITDPKELRALKTLFTITTSSEDDLITTNRENGGPEIFMRPKESLLVPFKYSNMAYDFSQSLQDSSMEETFVQQLNNLNKMEIIKEIIFRTSDGKLLVIVKLKIFPQPPNIDQTFRFYNPELSYLRKIIRLPPICVIAGPYDTIKVLTKCSDPAVVAQSYDVPVGTPHDLFLKVNCGPHPDTRRFLLVIYADRFMLAPIQVWHFIIHSLKRLDVVAFQSRGTDFPLSLKDSSVNHRIQIFSSHPNELSVGHIDTGRRDVKLSLTPLRIGSRRFQVNVVDGDDRKVVSAWLICAICKEPVVAKSFQLKLPGKGGDECKKKVSYQNPYGEIRRFFLITDRQDLIMFKQPILQIGPNNTDYIGIIFVPTTYRGVQKIFVFINDDNGKNEETFSISVDYM